jgi:anaerobic magnesium-protoporphyrin IX monomethyl ester cyclase
VLWHYPRFVMRNAPKMCRHTFRGSTWRSAIGLESEREVFRRYKQIRAAEREYTGPLELFRRADNREVPAST